MALSLLMGNVQAATTHTVNDTFTDLNELLFGAATIEHTGTNPDYLVDLTFNLTNSTTENWTTFKTTVEYGHFNNNYSGPGTAYISNNGYSGVNAAGTLELSGLNVLIGQTLTFSITAEGGGSYTYVALKGQPNIEVSAVPVPAAAWLFGSGLIGLTGVARRKKAA
jgi:hypothetical protein